MSAYQYPYQVPPPSAGALTPRNGLALFSGIAGIAGWVLNLLLFCFNFTIGSLIVGVTMGVGAICLLPLSCIPILAWLAAIIMGHIAMGKIKSTGEAGRGWALTGLICGYVGIGLLILLTILVVILLAVGVIGAGSLGILGTLLGGLDSGGYYGY